MKTYVLLVDDEIDAIELFRQSFRREIRRGELEIRFTTSGDEALALLAGSETAERFLVLSDINMPGMTGLELLREVKKRWPRLVVIMVSAYGDAENRRRAIDYGASDFVTKPVDFGYLRQTLGTYVAGDGI
jgi:CheY-like chemotaxis protein